MKKLAVFVIDNNTKMMNGLVQELDTSHTCYTPAEILTANFKVSANVLRVRWPRSGGSGSALNATVTTARGHVAGLSGLLCQGVAALTPPVLLDFHTSSRSLNYPHVSQRH